MTTVPRPASHAPAAIATGSGVQLGPGWGTDLEMYTLQYIPGPVYVYGLYCALTADGGASCIEDGGLSQLTLDGQYNAAGGQHKIISEMLGFGLRSFPNNLRNILPTGVRVSTCMGCSIGPLLYVIHFTERGIWVDGGHEVMVHRSWGETRLLASVFSRSKGQVALSHRWRCFQSANTST